MSLKMQCTDCRKSYKVEDSWAGKRVKCKACGNIMVVPTPVVQVEASGSHEVAGFEGAVAPVAVQAYTPPAFVAPPPAYADVAPPDSPYVTIPGEDLIDQWVPWAAVGLLTLDLVIAGLVGMSHVGATSRLSSSSTGVVFVIALVFAIALIVATTAASGALMLLGVYISSQIMKFPNHRLLYWRCIAAACIFLLVNSVLAQIGLDISAARYFLAIVLSAGVLWLLLRLRGPQFALAGGLAMLLGIILPGGILLLLAAGLKSMVHGNSRNASAMSSPPPIVSPSGVRSAAVASQVDPRAALRQTSAAHLKQINLALIRYAQDHANAGPPYLESLVSEGELTPEDMTAPGGLTYHFAGYSPQAAPNAVVAYEEGNRAVLGGVNILTKDGTVQFYAWNSGDYLINPHRSVAANNAPPVLHPPPVYTPPQTKVDANAMLQKLATADQSYFRSHNSTYPRQSHDLVTAGLLKQEDLQMGDGQVLQPSMGMPKLATLPPDFIAAYVLDFKARTYTVLFGDWHIQTVSMTEFREVLHKSQLAARAFRQ